MHRAGRANEGAERAERHVECCWSGSMAGVEGNSRANIGGGAWKERAGSISEAERGRE